MTRNSHRRSEYKAVWTALSDTPERAKMHVIGSSDEADFAKTGRETLHILQESVGIRPEDVVLEIGCGIGRVGEYVAPLCRKWIGCDVSGNMLRLAAERLQRFANVQLREIPGYDLRDIGASSADVVYCTVVFMHLQSWDRYNYVLEAYRVLRPGGRFYVDNVNLCSDGGWKVFDAHRAFPPGQRPAHITECSTPEEIATYLQRAGFANLQMRDDDPFVRACGVKPE